MLDKFEKIYAPVLTGRENLNSREIQVLCPFHDDKNASMSINTESGLYHCFGCNASGSAIGFYMKYNNLSYPEALKELDMDKPYNRLANRQIISKEKPKKEYTDYFNYCHKVWNETIMHDEFYEFYCKKLYDLRGITLPTAVCCFIGYDADKGWIFPCIEYKTKKIIGYEIREKHFQKFKFENGKETKCYKAKNTPSCLCWIYEASTRKAIICEGFIDSFKMYQYQLEKVQKFKSELAQVECSILTASCGVKSIPELVEEHKLWNDFDEIIFCLDNDEAGNLANKKLMELPHNGKFKFFNQIPLGKDFENYYEEVLKPNLYK